MQILVWERPPGTRAVRLMRATALGDRSGTRVLSHRCVSRHAARRLCARGKVRGDAAREVECIRCGDAPDRVLRAQVLQKISQLRPVETGELVVAPIDSNGWISFRLPARGGRAARLRHFDAPVQRKRPDWITRKAGSDVLPVCSMSVCRPRAAPSRICVLDAEVGRSGSAWPD